MRLTRIELENFKGIGPQQRIALKPITLLFGPNSAGKSTILQALHYMREILERQNVDPDMTIAGGRLDLGGFKSVVHKHDLARSIKIKLEVALSDFDALESPQDADDQDRVDLIDDLTITMASNFENGLLPHNALTGVALDLELRWSAQHTAPYVSRWGVELNQTPFAAITSVPETGRAFLREFNFDHPLLAAGEWDDTSSLASLEGWIRDLSREVAIQHAQADSPDTEMRIAVRTLFGALPDLDLPLRLDLRDPDDDEFEVVDDLARPRLLTTLLTELVLGPGRLVRDCLAEMTYIGPLRQVPARDFIAQVSPDESRWATGLAAWDQLHSSRGLEIIERANYWLFDRERLNSGYRLEQVSYRKIPEIGPISVILDNGVSAEDLVDVIPTLKALFHDYPISREVRLRDVRTGALLAPSDVGVGLSQLIPVIVSLVSDDDGLLAIEQPELHIHPAMQVWLGDLLATAATSDPSDLMGPRGLLIETHSEHIMLRLLRRIRQTSEGELPPDAPALTPDDVAVIYVEPTEDALKFTALPITPDGDFLHRWPHGFFEERSEELFE